MTRTLNLCAMAAGIVGLIMAHLHLAEAVLVMALALGLAFWTAVQGDRRG